MSLSKPYRFLFRLLLWAIPLGVPIALFELSLWRAGETLSVGEVSQALAKHSGALFGRQFFDQGLYRFKWTSILRLKPAILAIGNSRVMQLRKEMFGARANDFFNAGGMVQHVRDLEQFVAALPMDSRLTCVIVGVEFSWFNAQAALEMESARNFSEAIRTDEGRVGFSHGHVFQQVLRNGFASDISRPSWAAMASAWRGGDATAVRAWGFMARNFHMGFRSDGSFDYGLAAPVDWTFQDRERPAVLDRIRAGSRGFQPTRTLSQALEDRFVACLQALKDRGISVLCFAPPYPASVITALESSPGLSDAWRQYREELPQRIRRIGCGFIDASTPSLLGMDDRCMRDGLHAMESFHVRLLAVMLADPVLEGQGFDLAYVRHLSERPTTNLWFPDYETGR